MEERGVSVRALAAQLSQDGGKSEATWKRQIDAWRAGAHRMEEPNARLVANALGVTIEAISDPPALSEAAAAQFRAALDHLVEATRLLRGLERQLRER